MLINIMAKMGKLIGYMVILQYLVCGDRFFILGMKLIAQRTWGVTIGASELSTRKQYNRSSIEAKRSGKQPRGADAWFGVSVSQISSAVCIGSSEYVSIECMSDIYKYCSAR